MTDSKNIKDDYYSNISSGDSGDKKTSSSTPKIKPKKLLVKKAPIKKIEPISEVSEKEEVSEKNEEKKIKFQGSVIAFHQSEKKPEPKKIEKKPLFSEGKAEKRFVHKKPLESRPTFQRKKTSEEDLGKRKFPKSNAILTSSESLKSSKEKENTFNQKKKIKRTFNKTDDVVNMGKKFKSRNKGKRKLLTPIPEKDIWFKRAKKMKKKKAEETNIENIKQNLIDRSGQEVSIPAFITVKEFSDKIGIPVGQVVTELLKNGVVVHLNTQIDFETCFLVGEAFNITIIRKETADDISVKSMIEGSVEDLIKNDSPDDLKPRAPIISVMGHVDHGKTSILDYIRKDSIAAREAWGITQSIGSYQITHNNKKITFLDTPGHEAFLTMRARWAKLTDIIILVVAADEGIKPQTVESINLAKEADVPVIVAINKMDKPGANPENVKWELAKYGLQSEDWGGDVICVPVSAHTGLGINTLLDMILLTSEMGEYKANPNRFAIGTVIESYLDPKMGPVATILINSGTLRKTDTILSKSFYGKIKILRNYLRKNISEAEPSTPVFISGLSWILEWGDVIQAVRDTKTAKQKAHEYELVAQRKSISQFEGASLAMLMGKVKTGSLKQLKIILKADTNGSLEALKAALEKLSTSKTQVTIIHGGVGNVNESDVLMAGTSTAILIGFNVGVLENARTKLQNTKIEFIHDKVIYHIIERIEEIVTGMIDIEMEKVFLGKGFVKAFFYTSKERTIVGLGITEGKIENKARVSVYRNDEKIGEGRVDNLKLGVENVHEVEEGKECGISYSGVKITEGDTLDFYKMVEKK